MARNIYTTAVSIWTFLLCLYSYPYLETMLNLDPYNDVEAGVMALGAMSFGAIHGILWALTLLAWGLVAILFTEK